MDRQILGQMYPVRGLRNHQRDREHKLINAILFFFFHLFNTMNFFLKGSKILTFFQWSFQIFFLELWMCFARKMNEYNNSCTWMLFILSRLLISTSSEDCWWRLVKVDMLVNWYDLGLYTAWCLSQIGAEDDGHYPFCKQQMLANHSITTQIPQITISAQKQMKNIHSWLTGVLPLSAILQKINLAMEFFIYFFCGTGALKPFVLY